MNKIINKFLLAGDKFMPELHVKQPGVLVDYLLNILKKFKNIDKLAI